MALVVLVLLTSLAAPAADAALLGVRGDAGRFDRLTRAQHEIGHVMIGWNKGLRPGGPKLGRVLALGGALPMIHIGTGTGWPNPREAITPRDIALGKGDRFLRALNGAIADRGDLVYVRPMAEMNAHGKFYSAFDASGSRRDAAHSTRWFKKAFARIYLFLHGGSSDAINRELNRLGLPRIGQGLAQTGVRVIWNPQGLGSPNVPGNAPQAYWPGGRFVDVVGDDLYDIRGRAEWAAAEALYKRYKRKPFAFPEWGLWGIDDPQFVYRMAKFVRTHPRVELIAYFQSKSGSIFDLASKPRSLAAYRRAIAPLAAR